MEPLAIRWWPILFQHHGDHKLFRSHGTVRMTIRNWKGSEVMEVGLSEHSPIKTAICRWKNRAHRCFQMQVDPPSIDLRIQLKDSQRFCERHFGQLWLNTLLFMPRFEMLPYFPTETLGKSCKISHFLLDIQQSRVSWSIFYLPAVRWFGIPVISTSEFTDGFVWK